MVAFTKLSFGPVLVAFAVFAVLELLLPVLTQGGAGGTPWHPHHVAERYGLFAIITLGEGVVGTVASSGGLLGGPHGTEWTANAVAVVVAGVGLTFGMWWVYFSTPFGDILVHRRARGYLFGYGHMLVFAGIAGAGAGLHVAGLYLEHHAKVGAVAVVLSLALPVGLYLLVVYLLHTLLLSAGDRFHLLLISLTLAVLGAAVLLSAAGAPVAGCWPTSQPAVPRRKQEPAHRHQQPEEHGDADQHHRQPARRAPRAPRQPPRRVVGLPEAGGHHAGPAEQHGGRQPPPLHVGPLPVSLIERRPRALLARYSSRLCSSRPSVRNCSTGRW